MAMSDDVLAMTFSSDHSSSVQLDGMLMDSHTAAAVLKEARRRPKVKDLTLRGVTIDDTVARAVVDLFSDSKRSWGKLELIHCTGHIARVVEASIRNIEQFAFTGSVPIAHNPRYSFDNASMRALGTALGEHQNLVSLSLKGSGLGQDGLKAFGIGLKKSKSLQTFQLSHCAIESPDVSLLASALKGNEHLTSLSIAHCKIAARQTEESMAQFCHLLASLVSHPTLQMLNLLGMHCPPKAVKILSDLLRSRRSKLWHLGLKNNVRSPEDKVEVVGLFHALKFNSALSYLQVSGNNVNDSETELLAEIVATSNHTLRALSLTANNIGDDGILSFARRLPDMKGIRLLDFQRNPHTQSSRTKIVAALKDNMELERLDLDGTSNPKKAFYLRLNKGGRRLLQAANNTPLGLWPLVLQRANRLPFSRNMPFAHLDIIYALVKGPALFQLRQKRSRNAIVSSSVDDIVKPTKKRARRT